MLNWTIMFITVCFCMFGKCDTCRCNKLHTLWLSAWIHYTLFEAGKQNQRICLSRESVVPQDALHLSFKLHINFTCRAKFSRFHLVKFRTFEWSPAFQPCLILSDYSSLKTRPPTRKITHHKWFLFSYKYEDHDDELRDNSKLCF